MLDTMNRLMPKSSRLTTSSVRALALVLAAGLGLGLGACVEDSEGDPVPLDVQVACKSYCRQATDCNDKVVEDDCREDCYDNMNDCQADEQNEAVDDLQNCADESCNDFTACTIGAGLQCSFGIDI